ncbi:MAG: phage tail protein [Deltaproteobacteria bacterium]|nr:phage tail protein [Deltaproteobacteria bacterium]MCW5803014.1 phage tail protein [Deltaproteobacteria bacterium]
MSSNPGDRHDPLPCFCFLVAIPGVQAFFKSVSGLKYETEVVQMREGGANDTTYNLVGATKWSPIVLKNGFTADSKLLTWREGWATGKSMVRQSGTITQLDTALRPMARWTFHRGWPSKWELGELDASKSEISIETLEIVHEGLTYKAIARPAPPAPAKPSKPGTKPAAPKIAPPPLPTPPAAPKLQREATHAVAPPASIGRAPTQDELISLNKARFSDIEEIEEIEEMERREKLEKAQQVKDEPADRAPTEDELISLGKARFPDVE